MKFHVVRLFTRMIIHKFLPTPCVISQRNFEYFFKVAAFMNDVLFLISDVIL